MALFGFALRAGIALRDIDVVDRLFIPDDTYYTLAIARSLARGLGPTVDGLHLTNGFQPLLAFVAAPNFRLTASPDAALRAVLLLLAACDAGVAFALGELARTVDRAKGGLAAVLATSAWALSPFAVGYALGGLETSLALLTLVALALAWRYAHVSGNKSGFMSAGVVAGLALLARIDVVLVIVPLGLLELVRGRRGGALIASASALAVVLPWWSYEVLRLGTIVPESGPAVREQVLYHQSLYLTVPEQVAYALGTVCEPAFARALDLRDLLSSAPKLAVVAAPLGLAGFGYGVCRLVPREGGATVVRTWLLATSLYGLFYTFYLPAVWFFPRYLAPIHAALTVLAAVAAARWLQHGRRLVQVATGAAVAIGLVGSALATAAYLRSTPEGTVDQGLHGAKGYHEPAHEILRMLPAGAVVGAFQSGALAYYAPEVGNGVSIVNLDGVVDREAGRAFRNGSLVEFARERGVTHLADWAFNIEAFGARSGDARWSTSHLHVLGSARPQGRDRFTAYSVGWP